MHSDSTHFIEAHWANFATTQVHQFIKEYPEVISENALIQNKMIEDWLKDKPHPQSGEKLSLFKSLNTEVIFQEMTKMNLKYLTLL